MSDVVVSIEEAHRVYNPGPHEVRAMNGVNLTIEKGDFMAIVGPSGSGKSTVLNCIGCLDTPTEGRVLVEGKNTTLLKPSELSLMRNHRIGFIFQSFNLIPVMTAYENIEFALQIHGGFGKKEMHDRVMTILEILNLTKHKDHRPGQMSGGQQQRVAVGRALVKEPALILADEPTANLDRQTSQDIIDLMQRLNRDQDATFIFSTHDEHLVQHTERQVRLVDGRVVSDEREGDIVVPQSVEPQ